MQDDNITKPKKPRHKTYADCTLAEKAKRLAASRKWKAENKEHLRRYIKGWKAENAEHVAQYDKDYAAAHKEQRLTNQRRSLKRNAEQRKLKRALDHKLNPQKRRIEKQKWVNNNPDKVDAYRPKARASSARYRKNNPALANTISRNRRARIRGAKGRHTVADELAQWEKQTHKCAVPNCPHPISDVRGDPNHYHVDHYEPVSKSLDNSPANIMILCPTHNTQKAAKDPYEWAQTLELAQRVLFVK